MFLLNTAFRIAAVVIEFGTSIYIIDKQSYALLAQLVFFQLFCMPLAAGMYLYFINRKPILSLESERLFVFSLVFLSAIVLLANNKFVEAATLILSVIFYIRLAVKTTDYISNYIFFGLFCKNLFVILLLAAGLLPASLVLFYSVLLSCVVHELCSLPSFVRSNKNNSNFFGILSLGFMMQFLMYSELHLLELLGSYSYLAEYRINLQLIFIGLVIQQASNQTHIEKIVENKGIIRLHALFYIGFKAMLLSLVFYFSVDSSFFVLCVLFADYSVKFGQLNSLCSAFLPSYKLIVMSQIITALSIGVGPIIIIAKLANKVFVLCGIAFALICVKTLVAIEIVNSAGAMAYLVILPAVALAAANIFILFVLIKIEIVKLN